MVVFLEKRRGWDIEIDGSFPSKIVMVTEDEATFPDLLRNFVGFALAMGYHRDSIIEQLDPEAVRQIFGIVKRDDDDEDYDENDDDECDEDGVDV